MYDRYWDSMTNLVDKWASYNAIKQLYINATHPETYHQVAKVVSDYWGGDPEKVKITENERLGEVVVAIKSFNDACTAIMVEPFSSIDYALNWLFNNMKKAPDYESVRKKIERRKARDAEPEPIENLCRKKKGGR